MASVKLAACAAKVWFAVLSVAEFVSLSLCPLERNLDSDEELVPVPRKTESTVITLPHSNPESQNEDHEAAETQSRTDMGYVNPPRDAKEYETEQEIIPIEGGSTSLDVITPLSPLEISAPNPDEETSILGVRRCTRMPLDVNPLSTVETYVPNMALDEDLKVFKCVRTNKNSENKREEKIYKESPLRKDFFGHQSEASEMDPKYPKEPSAPPGEFSQEKVKMKSWDKEKVPMKKCDEETDDYTLLSVLKSWWISTPSDHDDEESLYEFDPAVLSIFVNF